MKDLIAQMLAALPAYAKQLIELLSAPKAFVAKKELASPTAIKKALTFLAISFGLAYIAQIPFLPETQNKELMFGVLAIGSAFGFILNIAVLAFSWKIVGGKLGWKKYVVATCYFSSVSTLLFLGVSLLAGGIFNILDPVLYKQVLAGFVVDPDDWSIGYKASLIILGIGFLAVYAWILGIWGAYRKLNHLSRLRSGIAFTVFVMLSPLVFLVETFMGSSTFLQHYAYEPLPAELVGSWETMRQTNFDGVLLTERVGYKFVPERIYFSSDWKLSANGRCIKTTQYGAWGRVTVQGSTLILTSKQRTEIIDDKCSGKRSERPMEPRKTVEVYQYQIHKNVKSWELCLNGRFGEICLTPNKQ